MAEKDTISGMATGARRVHGLRTLGSLIPAVTRPAFRTMHPAAAQVMADWASIVGPVLASASAPRRLAAGTLTLACAGPVAMELQHYAPELISRINTHLGTTVVRAVRFVQTLPRAAVPRPAPASTTLPAWAVAGAEAAVAELPAGELREALAALGRAVLAATAADNGASTS